MTSLFRPDSWGKEDVDCYSRARNLTECGVQTKPLAVEEVGVQSVELNHVKIQTDEVIEEDIQLYDDDSDELLQFVQKMEPFIIKELQKNCRSHAFDGYTPRWEDDTGAVSCTKTLRHSALNGELPITGLSWNCTGSVIAVAYGGFVHEDWCTHRSALCTWNLDRRTLDPDKPDSVVELPSCLMSVAYHPTKPSIIAGGTFNGEVMVWNTSKEDETLMATSGIGEDSHKEPVCKLHWVLDSSSSSKRHNLVSVSSDGRILVWRIRSQKQTLQLVDGFVLLTESLPRELRLKAKRGDLQMGVSCISYSPDDETTFLIGSESGGVFKCSTNCRGTPASRDQVCSIQLRSPVTFSFLPHDGPVSSVQFSPYHRNLFLSCGTDSSARIYSMLQAQPLVSVDPAAGYLYSAKWSPTRPLVFAVATENGSLHFYDLKTNRAAPTLKLEVSAEKTPVYSMEFNRHKPELLATGDMSGRVQIWRLSNEMIEQDVKEQDILDDMANSVLE